MATASSGVEEPEPGVARVEDTKQRAVDRCGGDRQPSGGWARETAAVTVTAGGRGGAGDIV
jgi:hypothetical protein